VAIRYPPARAADLVDFLHGVPVADPYRWLEDAAGGETRAWVDAQNALTRSQLDGPARDTLVGELTELLNYPRTSSLQLRGRRYVFTHNPGLLDQPILYAQDGIDASPIAILDPNRLSADGTTALTAFFPSPDGRLVACALSHHGSDRQEIRILEVPGGRDTGERLHFVKFASLAWTRDGGGFYYLRFPAPGTVPLEDEQYFGRIYFHRLGDPQASDPVVFEAPGQKEVVPVAAVSADDRWAVITAQRGASDDSEIHLVDRRHGGPPRPLFTGFDAAYSFIEAAGDRLFFTTTKGAPRGRIVSVDANDPAASLREVVAESKHRLSGAVMTRGALVAHYLQFASDRLWLFDLAGLPLGEIPLPEIGTVVTLDAEPDSDETLFTFTSFTQPPSAWMFRLPSTPPGPGEAGAALPFRSRGLRLQAEGRGTQYVTRFVWYPSKDGTQVSMFLVHRQDRQPDADTPVLLSGYGGFNISRTPQYDPGNFPWLDGGGIFALAHLRGGGEYGEDWHRAGMLERKQNVFDDFIAAAEALIGQGYTSAGRIAIEGGSNGGLLVAAVMLQRPELFGAVLCRVPVADMLRYHLFTVGRFWIPEYGSADDPGQFAFLLRYSPYHNVRRGVRYPPTLVMTADTDDRVDPGMAKKFAARLQADGDGGPFLIRVETKAGHGAGKPVSKIIEEEADMLVFLQASIAAASARAEG
jgi:prolyl oligopeptidase